MTLCEKVTQHTNARPQNATHSAGVFAIVGRVLRYSRLAAYAELGDFQQAVQWQQKAFQMAGKEIKDDLAARLELYRQGQPFREKPQGGPFRECH